MDGKGYNIILESDFECYHIRRIAWTSQQNLEAGQSQVTVRQLGIVVGGDRMWIEVIILKLQVIYGMVHLEMPE